LKKAYNSILMAFESPYALQLHQVRLNAMCVGDIIQRSGFAASEASPSTAGCYDLLLSFSVRPAYLIVAIRSFCPKLKSSSF